MAVRRSPKPLVGVRFPPPEPNKARSYKGHYAGLSIRTQGFDSPTSRQVLYTVKEKLSWGRDSIINGSNWFIFD